MSVSHSAHNIGKEQVGYITLERGPAPHQTTSSTFLGVPDLLKPALLSPLYPHYWLGRPKLSSQNSPW